MKADFGLDPSVITDRSLRLLFAVWGVAHLAFGIAGAVFPRWFFGVVPPWPPLHVGQIQIGGIFDLTMATAFLIAATDVAPSKRGCGAPPGFAVEAHGNASGCAGEAIMSHFRFVQDWLEGWNSRDPDRVMAHYAEDAVFQSPSVLALGGSSDGMVRGRREIAAFNRRAVERFPKLRFELEDVIEQAHRVIVIYRKLGVFADNPGFTVEVFEFENDLVKRNVVYWSAEEVASRFRALSS